jgi:hypothetical protein
MIFEKIEAIRSPFFCQKDIFILLQFQESKGFK